EKSQFIRKNETRYYELLDRKVTTACQVPVLINYGKGKTRGERPPISIDFETISKVNDYQIQEWVPTNELPYGVKTEEPKNTHGLRNVNQLYSKRNLSVLARIHQLCEKDSSLLFWFSSIYSRTHRMNRYMPNHHRHVGPMAGTLYIPYFQTEINIFNLLQDKLDSFKALDKIYSKPLVYTNSCEHMDIPNDSIDYIFLDPPFGANINYSELSFILENWIKVRTNNQSEAIKSKTQNKGNYEYRELMTKCFSEAYRVLKPGHWMTVEFSNTDSAIWNCIQTSLSEVGFIIASVNALDKGRGGMNSIIGPTAVKQDLILSLYKPDESFEQQITTAVGTESVWTFVRKHLEYLPLVKKHKERLIAVPERDPRIIYDHIVSYFVGHNMLLPISSPDFLSEMPRRFVDRNGLYYLPEQAQQYDKLVARQLVETENMETSLFVCDENSAIAWIRSQLKEKPMTLGEMTPLFMQELSSWTKGERKPELRELLEQNFLCYNGIEDVPSQVHSYLSTNFKDLRSLSKDNPTLREKGKGRWYIPDPNKAGDLEKIREKALLKEFSIYESSKGKIKEFRIEAIRAGFKKAWQDKNYALIKNICERMPSAVVEEDEKLLMWYSNSLSRLGE
ncbi:MAG: DNA methylase, partial [Spirochaetales bacterium]|nr:DNA methylase [Spirochaetales bacterium]